MSSWSFDKGNSILTGFDNILGVQNFGDLLMEIINRLHARRFFILELVIQQWQGSFLVWKRAIEILLVGHNVEVWIITFWNLEEWGCVSLREEISSLGLGFSIKDLWRCWICTVIF